MTLLLVRDLKTQDNSTTVCVQYIGKNYSALFNCGEEMTGRYLILLTDNPSLLICELTINNRIFDNVVSLSSLRNKNIKSFIDSLSKITFRKFSGKKNSEKHELIKSKYKKSVSLKSALKELDNTLMELGINRALNRPSFQKSYETNSTESNFGNDGEVNTCSVTRFSERSYEYPWWMVQMDDDTIVQKIVLISESTIYFDKMIVRKYLFIFFLKEII